MEAKSDEDKTPYWYAYITNISTGYLSHYCNNVVINKAKTSKNSLNLQNVWLILCIFALLCIYVCFHQS